MRKPSPAQFRVLGNLARGRSAFCHLSGQSAWGGSESTQRSLLKRGWVFWWNGELKLSSAGRVQAYGGKKHA